MCQRVSCCRVLKGYYAIFKWNDAKRKYVAFNYTSKYQTIFQLPIQIENLNGKLCWRRSFCSRSTWLWLCSSWSGFKRTSSCSQIACEINKKLEIKEWFFSSTYIHTSFTISSVQWIKMTSGNLRFFAA